MGPSTGQLLVLYIPCPFCGSSNISQWTVGTTVQCNSCGAAGDLHRWNTRVAALTESAPALAAPHNSGERLPSSDAAEVGADTALKDAHDHLKAAIAEMKGVGTEPPMSIYKAMHALTYALREADDRGHYAEGTAALAMKHRDEAEVKLAEAKKALEPFAACVFNDNGDVTITTSYLRTEHYMRAAKVVFSGEIGK